MTGFLYGVILGLVSGVCGTCIFWADWESRERRRRWAKQLRKDIKAAIDAAEPEPTQEKR